MNRLYSDYATAEKDCDMIAGDNEFHMVVVERFDLESPDYGHRFAAVVINHNDLDEYVRTLHDDDFEVIYQADHTPETRARMS